MPTSGGTTGTPTSIVTNIDYLIPALRFHLGDMIVGQYTYLDEWLSAALVQAVKNLGVWWSYKYLVSIDGNVYRNSYATFYLEEPPIIQTFDERPIILMAAILIKSGQLENSAYNIGSWKDAEISYSNIEGGKLKSESLKQDWAEIRDLLKPPTKKLAWTTKNSLPGFQNNVQETHRDEIDNG